MIPHETIAIDALPAGRALDALVAEQVMGWSEINLAEKNLCYGDADFEGFFGTGVRPGLTVKYRTEIPHYSTSIAAAWEVVSHLYKTRWMRLHLEYGGEEFPYWGARFKSDGYRPFQNQSWDAQADTAPLAICRASLKAVGC